jgi:HAD superfamily hydrolase (TIGR01509 family)
MDIRLICFDLGGVLVRLTPSYRHGAMSLGLDAPDEATVARQWDASQRWHYDFETGRIDEDAYFDGLAKVFPWLTRANIVRIFDGWLNTLQPGVLEVWDALERAGRDWAILSNTNPRHGRACFTAGGPFEGLMRAPRKFLSYQIGAYKPEPAIYEHVEATTGLPGTAILFFDDVEANVQAARARGWSAQHIDPRGHTGAQMMDHLRRLDLV